MDFEITGNHILDFALIQAASILYLSEASLPLVKWMDSEDQSVRELKVPPAAAWFEKAAGSRLKTLPEEAKPCMKTTGLSIQVLSRLADILPHYQLQTYLSKPSLHREWRVIAGLQLQFCFEYLESNPCSLAEMAAVLEGGAFFMKSGTPEAGDRDFLPDLKRLYDRITDELDINKASTMDLAEIIHAVSLWFDKNGFKHRDAFLTSLVLEVLNRKSRTGLFHFSPDGFASVPMGQQFYILDALLKSYPFVQLDNILEEAFNVFSNLYRIAYKEAYEMFAFRHRNISYTPFDTGALLSCLDSIAKYSPDDSEQKAMIEKIVDDFLNVLINSYNELHMQDIRKLLRWICLVRECRISMENKPSIHTIFPKRIYLEYPGTEINWNRKGIVSQKGVFFLCASMLSLLDTEIIKTDAAPDLQIDLPALETLKMLFDLFMNH